MSAKRTLFALSFFFALAISAAAALSPRTASAAEPEGQAKTASAAMMPSQKKLPPGFEPVAGADKKTEIDPNPLVIGAYAMFFVAMFGYVVYVAKSQAAIAKEMQDLAKRLERVEKK